MDPILTHISHDDTSIPAHKRSGDAGFDLVSADECSIAPFERKLIATNLSLAIPYGYAGLIVPRSGLALHHGITVANAPGLIDSNYRGDIGVILVNLDKDSPYTVHKGDRIAQLVVVKVEDPSFELSETLPESNRGSGGFGSSGY